ncbi:origin recognition complex subunit 4, partial [Elasticomyces elasticus]
MDDSPRFAKRRKLETPRRSRITSTPSKTSAAGSSKRLTRSGALRDALVDSQNASNGQTPLRVAVTAFENAKEHGVGNIQEELNIYNDIDGGLAWPIDSKTSSSKKRHAERSDTGPAGLPGRSWDEGVEPYASVTNSSQPVAEMHKASGGSRASRNHEVLEIPESPTGEHGEPALPECSTSRKRHTPASRKRGFTRKATTNGQEEHGSGLQPSNKKTLEEEIKEVENHARDQGEDELANTPSQKQARRRMREDRTTDSAEIMSGTGGPEATPQDAVLERPKRRDRRRKSYRSHDHAEEVEGKNGNSVDDIDGRLEPLVDQELLRVREQTFNIDSDGKTARKPHVKASHAAVSHNLFSLHQKILMEKCTGKRAIPLIGLEDEYHKVRQIVEHTIAAGEGNSMLVIGARGSGKTALVNKVLREEALQHGADFHVVRLSGFIHTDDKLALREIWRQLGREMEIGDDGAARNYADTLSSLIALLSHLPDAEEGSNQVAKSVIFVLDGFELFTTHPRQTLLYNLFDIAQSSKAPIAVLGLTARFDVAESLEKRVKSRFSHRYVHLSLAKSFVMFRDICMAALLLQDHEFTLEERLSFSASRQDTKRKEGVGVKPREGAGDQRLSAIDEALSLDTPVKSWERIIQTLFETEALERHLRQIYHTTKSVPAFLTSCLTPLATLPRARSGAGGREDAIQTHLLSHFSTPHAANSLSPPDSKLSLLPSLSTLSLALLIAAARLTTIHDADT